MADLQAIDRELEVARKREDNHARVRLITRAIELPEAAPHRAEYLNELAYAYQQLGRFDDAVNASQAVTAGFDGELDDHPSAQALIADLLLRAGRTEEADDAWHQAQREDPDDPWLYQTAGCAHQDVGLHAKALAWQTKGLELALARGDDGDMIWMLTGERAETLDALGRPPDDLQLRAEELVERQEQEEQARAEAFHRDYERTRRVPPHRASIGLAWFAADEYERALESGRASPRTTSTALTPPTAPGSSCCCETSKPKASGGSRSHRSRSTSTSHGAATTTATPTIRQPRQLRHRTPRTQRRPHAMATQRNDPCWCGAGRKYKKCCLRAS